MRTLTFLFATGLLLSASATKVDYVFQPPAGDEPEAKIGFVQYRSIYSWHADNDRLLYLQGRDRQWYRVDLFAPCIGLEYAIGIRVLPSDAAGTFDRFGSIAFRGNRCKVESVKKVAPPAKTVIDKPAREGGRA